MSEKTISLSDTIIRLRGSFIEQLPGDFAEAHRFFDILYADPTDQEVASSLHRHLHNIKGNGAVLGFLELSALSGVGEELAMGIIENPGSLTSEIWQQLKECLTNMEQMLEHPLIQEHHMT